MKSSRGSRIVLSVASGKGGTGKTTVATSLALSLPNVQFLDCDVEEPNAHLFLKPRLDKRITVSIPVPRVDESRCTHCGLCAEVCAFNAIAVFPSSVLVFDHLCHGCGACSMLCPEKAIREVDHGIGVVEIGSRDGISFAHGILNIGEPMAPPVIRKVKAQIDSNRVVVIDASPGTSCPVVESVRNSNFCLLVTEPTPFGLNDLILAVEMLRVLGVPHGVVINRADIGDDRIARYCEVEGIPILMSIPFERRIAEGYSRGRPLVEIVPEYRERLAALFVKVRAELAAVAA